MKEAKRSTVKLEYNFPLTAVLKALKYKSCFGFQACQKNYLEFNDSTHTIY